MRILSNRFSGDSRLRESNHGESLREDVQTDTSTFRQIIISLQAISQLRKRVVPYVVPWSRSLLRERE